MTTCTVLASSSKANCIAVEGNGNLILIDCGLSARAIVSYMATLGLDPAKIDYCCITHEHNDHCAGLDGLIKRFNIEYVVSEGTANALDLNHWNTSITHDDERQLEITMFPIPHDAADPTGFVINIAGRRIGYCTDIGVVTKLMFERLKGCELLFIEANHDVRMAQASDRHDSLKHRIAGAHGHISNDAAGMLIAALIPHGLKKAVLCHLSKDSNEPSVALGTVKAAAPACEIHIADFGLKVTI